MRTEFSSSSLASVFQSTRLTATVGACSVQGKNRETNEDCEFVSLKHDLFIVSDGMGGHAAGEAASRFAVDSLSHELACICEEPHSTTEVEKLVGAALEHANCLILESGESNPQLRDAGATAVIALLFGHRLFVTGVGDSRAYSLRDGRLEQLTTDDSFAAAMELAGVITHEQAQSHPARHKLLNALGMKDFQPNKQIRILDVEAGDRFLLCTNGITGTLDDDQIREALVDHDDCIVAAHELVQRAVDGGANDDATAIVFTVHRCESDYHPQPTAAKQTISSRLRDWWKSAGKDD